MSHDAVAPLEPGVVVREYVTQDADHVLSLWAREDALDSERAGRRVHETVCVATGPDGDVVGTVSAHLMRSPRLAMTMWECEAFVATAHRRGNLALRFMLEVHDVLAARYRDGSDRRAAGMMVDVQHDAMRDHLKAAVWRSGLVFMAEDAQGNHARVRFFDGAQAPLPPEREEPGRPDPAQFEATAGFPELLARLGCSLLLAAPDAGALVLCRLAGDAVNIHLGPSPAPTALAAAGSVLAVGGGDGVTEFRDVPGVPGHDAWFVPRWAHHTGQIDVRDAAYAGDELWLASARFSCLATLDDAHSFVPRWQPDGGAAVTGVCVDGHEIAYATAGEAVFQVPSGEVVASGMDEPRTPRLHRGRLWLLAGDGLVVADKASGSMQTVAVLPGRPNGLALLDRYAFVGVSPGPGGHGECGVWVIDVEAGQIAAFLRFTDGVGRIAAVAVLAGATFPAVVEPGSAAALGAVVLP